MEIKAVLNKPYTEKEKIYFIIDQNRNLGYDIVETDVALEAWGYTNKEKKQEEKARIQELSMTRSDFFDGTIKAWGVDSEDLLPIVKNILGTLGISDIEKKIAINNYENALNFYRKHTLFTLLSGVPITIGDKTITVTERQWDNFFNEVDKRNPDAYRELLPDLES